MRKTCKKCGSSFPQTLSIDGKRRFLHKRLYCLRCSPFGENNTVDLSKQPKRGEVVFAKCKECGKEIKRVSGNRHGKSLKCNTCASNYARLRRKIKAVEYKGGRCAYCGYDRCLQALDFHHRDPEIKAFQISGNHCRSWEVVILELDKCDLVCSNCHHEIHAGLINNAVVV